MTRRSIEDRLTGARTELDVLLSEARLDAERKKMAYEKALAVLVDVEMAARRTVSGARAGRRPRHFQVAEREDGE